MPGHEHVPSEYRGQTLPGYVETVRSLFFGPGADQLLMNVRLAEIMSLLHRSDLSPRVIESDVRVTTDSGPKGLWGVLGTYETNVDQLRVVGDLRASDNRMIREIRFRREEGQIVVSDGEQDVSSADDGEFRVPKSQLTITIPTGMQEGDTGNLKLYLHPKENLGISLVRVEMLGGESAPLFADSPNRDYATLRDHWLEPRVWPDRVCALALALAYRTEDEGRSR